MAVKTTVHTHDLHQVLQVGRCRHSAEFQQFPTCAISIPGNFRLTARLRIQVCLFVVVKLQAC